MIQIHDLPRTLIQDLAKIISADEQQWNEDYARVMKNMEKLFAVDTSANTTTDVGGQGPGGSPSPVQGNIPASEVALMLLDAGATKQLAIDFVAIAGRESGYVSDNINFNGGGDGSSGDGSYDFGLFQFNTIHATGATNDGRGLTGPSGSADLAELKTWVAKQPTWVKDFYAQMSDPRIASAKAVRFAQKDSSYPDWIPGGKNSGNT